MAQERGSNVNIMLTPEQKERLAKIKAIIGIQRPSPRLPTTQDAIQFCLEAMPIDEMLADIIANGPIGFKEPTNGTPTQEVPPEAPAPKPAKSAGKGRRGNRPAPQGE